MNVKTVGIAIASLVIVGLIILFVVSTVIPEVFEYLGCAASALVNPNNMTSNDSSALGACADVLEFDF